MRRLIAGILAIALGWSRSVRLARSEPSAGVADYIAEDVRLRAPCLDLTPVHALNFDLVRGSALSFLLTKSLHNLVLIS